VRPETFEFDAEVVGAADDRQRAFLDALRDSIRRLAPVELDLPSTTATIDDGVLFVALPHRSQDDQLLAASVGPDEAVVYYGVEHVHFWPDDPANGRLWPIDAPDHAAAAGELVKAILAGHVELEVRGGILMQRATSYLVDDDGKRNVITRSGIFRLRRGNAGAPGGT
jgi:hypothetical protein